MKVQDALYLRDLKNSIDDLEAQGEFTLAFVTDDRGEMAKWAKRFLNSIKTGTPAVYIPDEETVKSWETRSLQFLHDKPKI
jgi:hypothetical protein